MACLALFAALCLALLWTCAPRREAWIGTLLVVLGMALLVGKR